MKSEMLVSVVNNLLKVPGAHVTLDLGPLLPVDVESLPEAIVLFPAPAPNRLFNSFFQMLFSYL